VIVRVEFVPNELWVGVFWKATPGKRYRAAVNRDGPRLGFTAGDPRTDATEAVTRWDVFIGLVPTLPVHLVWFRPRAVPSSAAAIVMKGGGS
jgi:hypothetical protein